MKKILESLLDLIYRKKCYFCGNSKYSLKMCPKCYSKLEFSEKKVNRIVEGVDIYCAGVYTKELQKLIRGIKYHKQKELAYFQAKFMYEYFLSLESLQGKDFELIPVPLNKKSQGYQTSIQTQPKRKVKKPLRSFYCRYRKAFRKKFTHNGRYMYNRLNF